MEDKETKEHQKALEMLEKAKRRTESEWQDLLKEDIIQYAPSINLRQEFEDFHRDNLVLTIRTWPKAVTWTDKKKIAQATMVMVVEYRGEDRSLWLSAESLRRSMMAIYQKIGESGVGQKILLTRRPYENKEWGDSIAYNCSIIQYEEDEDQTKIHDQDG